VNAPADKFKPNDVVKVYRDEAEVFADAAVRSFIARPVTNDHPTVAVDAKNWRQHSRGVVMGAMRDGDYLAFDLVLMDADTIADVDAGKRELSNGYQSHLDWTPGTTPDGQHYDARMVGIRGNHVAIVDAGRAGPNCRINVGDRFAPCESIPTTDFQPKPTEGRMKLTNLDGLSVNLSDSTAVEQALARLDAKVTEGQTALATAQTAHDRALAAKDAEIDGLKAKVVDQATIDRLADEKSTVVDAAKRIAGDKLGDTAGKTVAEVRKMTCDAVGIETKDRSDDYIAARFDALADAANDDKESVTTTDRQPFVPKGITNPVKVADNASAVATMRDLRYAN
jgi:hypothetical protein